MSRHAVRQKRSSSALRNSDVNEEVLHHVGTKQTLFLTTHLCVVTRQLLSSDEIFLESKALSLIDKYHRKRQSHCTAYFYDDRIKLERSKTRGNIPPHSWITYKQIIHLFIGKHKHEYLVMCIEEDQTFKKYYEVYKCKSEENAKKVKQLINNALNNSERVLTGIRSSQIISVYENGKTQSFCDSDVDEYSDPSTPSCHFVSPSPEIIHVSKKPNDLNLKTVNIKNVKKCESEPDLKVTKSIDNQTLKDLTYINIDPKKGAVIDKNGPIYMFFSRVQKHMKSTRNSAAFNRPSIW